MRNNTRTLGILAALTLLAAACGKEEKPTPDPTPTPTPSTKDEVKLSSTASATVSAEGGTATVQFTSSGKWTAALSNDRAASWLSLSASSGEKGSATITLTAAKNEETDDRSATVRITCGSASASFTLTQKQKDAITNTPSKTQFGADGGSFTIEVKANIDYSFEIDSDWIHQTSTKALTTKTTTFTVDKNEDTRKREGSVTVKSALGSEKITVYQEAAAPSIILSSENVSVKTGGGTFTVDVNTNVDVTMTITEGADWLSEVTTKAMSTHSYTFQAAPNEGNDAREGKISFKNEANGIEAVVTVTQMQKDAIVVAQSLYEIGAAGGTVSIEAATNVELDVQVSASWVHPVTTKALQTVSYDFEVDSNTGYDVRECNVTFSGGESVSVFSQSSPWSLIGTMGGDNWTTDIEMKTDGKWHVVRGVTFTSSDEFKFRKDKNWDVNLGLGSAVTLPGECQAVNLRQDGNNFKIAAGTYDIYLCPDEGRAYFLSAGRPFTFDGYNDSPQRLSQTVTIRQDGADGFLADFENQYTLSSSAQGLVLQSRSSVDIEAQSQTDWISIVSTKALSNRSVTLQIAENTSGSERVGKVVVSAPALGQSRTVTITQKAAGEMYIPDAAFYAWLLSQFDTDGNGNLSKSECDKVEKISLSLDDKLNIKSVSGLEYFPNLSWLDLTWVPDEGASQITDLVISANPKLSQLYLTNLSALKTLSLDCPDLIALSVVECPALSGVDLSRFKKLQSITLQTCPWLTALDCSDNKALSYLTVESCPALEKIIAPCPKLLTLNIWDCRALDYSDILLPQEDFTLRYLYINTIASFPEEIDLSMCPELKTIYFYSVSDSWKISTIWLRTGVILDECLGFAKDAEIRYKGDDALQPVQFQCTAFRDFILKYNQYYDINEDGELSAYELGKIDYLVAFSSWLSLDETITSLEDIGHLKNLEHFAMYGFEDKVSAPIPESLRTLTKLESFGLDDCRIQGTLPEWIADMPALTELTLEGCYPLGGEVPSKLLMSETLTYINLKGCAFTGCTIVVPKESFMDYSSKYYHPNTYFLFSPQREGVQRITQEGSGYVYDSPNILYQSDVDGTGAIHPDGEAVLYHAATKGPGIDLILTGDGFSAENNTVGGTLETYLTACAEQFLNQEPYDKLAEYYNVWLVYAHSRTAGTGVQYGVCTKFGARHTNPGVASTVVGNHYVVLDFVSNAIGRDCSNAVISVIMNSSTYGGTCYFSADSYILGKWNYTVGYTPTDVEFLPTFTHEVLGHGIGKLADEYNADYSNPGSSPSTYPYWEMLGIYGNVDNVSDPSQIRWHNFLFDPRYADEGLGVFEGAYYANYGWYRPSQNSVMNLQMAEGGDRFNAPSREAIYQRTMSWVAGLEVMSGYSNWASYIGEHYNYEEFVSFDKAPSPYASRAVARRPRRAPRKAVLHDGRVIEEKLPPRTPPVIINPGSDK